MTIKALGKQRVEAFHILCVLGNSQALFLRKNKNPIKGWKNHPAVRMWRGYEDALIKYYNESIWQWHNRGYKNTMQVMFIQSGPVMPPWFGLWKFHESHQSNLLRKDPVYYHTIFKVRNDIPYYWPVSRGI